MRVLITVFAVLLITFSLNSQTLITQKEKGIAQESFAKFVGKTPPLRSLVPRPAASSERKKANKKNRPPKNFIGRGIIPEANPDALPNGPDPIRQSTIAGKGLEIEPIVNRDGLTTGRSPHDPSGEIGMDYYIQIINVTTFQIFNKNGTAASGEINANTLWNSIGFTSRGDPIILYDSEFDRWIITEFPSGNQLLFAISETSDPFGSWMAYNFATPRFPDYPKYGIWDDSYYVTTNERGSRELTAYFINREDMINGEANVPIQRLTFDGFPNGPGFFAATPVNWSGDMKPDSTTHPMVLRLSDDAWRGSNQDQIDIISIKLDWNNTLNTEVTTQSVITAPFDADPCTISNGVNFACIPQPGGSGVDGIPSTIMNQVHYRNFGTHESMVLNFITDVTGNNLSGIRWMELRKVSGGDWSVYQEGTYAPDDGLHRYVGATAIDMFGNIAMAYAVSSEDEFVGLRLTGRRSGDPLGEMTVEEFEIAKGTREINSGGRYGDYAQMSVDPIDNRTFWFTSEYGGGSGTNTRIVAFRLNKDSVDMGPTALNQPQNASVLTDAETVQIRVTNLGIDTLTDFEVGYIFEDGTPVIESVDFTLPSDSSYTHTFAQTVDMSRIGDYEFKIFTNLQGDQGLNNDSLTLTRTKLPFRDASIIAIEGFAGSNCGDSIPVELVLQNFGTENLTSLTINLDVGGQAIGTINWTGDLAYTDEERIPVLITGMQKGANTLTAVTGMPNGDSDEVTANDNFSKDFEALPDGEIFKFSLRTDNNPEDNRWEIRDSDNKTIAGGGPYEDSFTTYDEFICLDPGECFRLIVFDSNNDGIDGAGGYNLTNGSGEVLINSAGNFTFAEQNQFCGSKICLLEVDVDISNASAGNDDGALMINLLNTGAFTFQISIDGGVTFSSESVYTDLPRGTYEIVVTDGADCTVTTSVEIGNLSSIATTESGQKITVYPNPTGGVFYIDLEGLQRQDVFLPIEIIDVTGKHIQITQLVRYDDVYTGQISLTKYPDGIYFVRFYDEKIDRLIKVFKQ